MVPSLSSPGPMVHGNDDPMGIHAAGICLWVLAGRMAMVAGLSGVRRSDNRSANTGQSADTRCASGERAPPPQGHSLHVLGVLLR